MKHKQHIFFIGIGGIGMSALARYFHLQGHDIAGYDLTSTALTQKLEREGISVIYDDKVEKISGAMKGKNTTLVVYTPAIPENNQIISWYRNQNFEVIKRAELLGKITLQDKSIAVAGTHGKTSISTFTAHLLYQSKVKCNAFLGGISANYNTNLLYSENASYTVIEADEFDRSFLHLNPQIALISSIDPDHLDIYGSFDAVKTAFMAFAEKATDNDGTLIASTKALKNITLPGAIKSYGLNSEADYQAINIRFERGTYHFDLKAPQGLLHGLSINLPGTYNLENAVAASALALEAGIGEQELRSGLTTLKGVERRFQVRLNAGVVYIDDYAHHPTEIEACILSAKEAFPGKKLTVAFQPHLYSRTKDFYRGFAETLSLADKIYLLPIYPAREEPIEGISSELIGREVQDKELKFIRKTELLDILESEKPEVFISMGAGDIGFMAEDIEATLKKHA